MCIKLTPQAERTLILSDRAAAGARACTQVRVCMCASMTVRGFRAWCLTTFSSISKWRELFSVGGEKNANQKGYSFAAVGPRSSHTGCQIAHFCHETAQPKKTRKKKKKTVLPLVWGTEMKVCVRVCKLSISLKFSTGRSKGHDNLLSQTIFWPTLRAHYCIELSLHPLRNC